MHAVDKECVISFFLNNHIQKLSAWVLTNSRLHDAQIKQETDRVVLWRTSALSRKPQTLVQLRNERETFEAMF